MEGWNLKVDFTTQFNLKQKDFLFVNLKSQRFRPKPNFRSKLFQISGSSKTFYHKFRLSQV